MSLVKIGITGQGGFIGYHLVSTLGLYKDDFEIINFDKLYFANEQLLDKFVSNCDVIIHLAAVNRHEDDSFLHDTNIRLVELLINALVRTNSTPQIIISSSTQEILSNQYGISKKLCRELFITWSKSTNSNFVGMLIPNVFGPFCKPHYNSFIATFSDQLIKGDEPLIDVDKEVSLIYINDLVNVFIDLIKNKTTEPLFIVSPTIIIKVSDVLKKLVKYKEVYFKNGEIPALNDDFDLKLFNTFRSYIPINSYFPKPLIINSDNRGDFVEIIRIGIGGQVSFSTTKPSVTRGNHFHTRKIERFAVIKGAALIQMRRLGFDEIIELYLDESKSAYVDIPIWYTHNIKNIGTEELYTIFWINEKYNASDPDTFFENVIIKN